MSFKFLIALTFFFSISASSMVTLDQKRERLELLKNLPKSSLFNVGAFERTLRQESLGMSIEQMAEEDSNLLASKIRTQLALVWEAALASHPDEARALEEVQQTMERDLQLIDPELQDEIRWFTEETLQRLQSHGGATVPVKLEKLKEIISQEILYRSEFFNHEAVSDSDYLPQTSPGSSPKLEYRNSTELLVALLSNEQSASWVTTANQSATSGVSAKNDLKISLRVKTAYLGVELELGPTFTFKRTFQTEAVISAEGLTPVLLPDGNFDFSLRDRAGRVIKRNGKPVRRFVSFSCNASLEFETENSGSGGFSFLGLGATQSVSQNVKNSVTMTSRRLIVPDYVGGKTVTIQYLGRLCHTQYLSGRVSNQLRVYDSLNAMMRNYVNGLRFSHPKTQCGRDQHCRSWFSRDVMSLMKKNNVPRCVQERREGYMACELRGTIGQNCPVPDNRGRIKPRTFEFFCDRGLNCVQVSGNGLLAPGTGKCMPVSSRRR